MSKKTTSVLIPTLNRPDDLKKCLNSLVAQTLPPDEIVIVDQSTDERTKDLVDQFKLNYGDKIKNWIYVRQQERSLVHARNNAVKNSTGEIVCFLDDDIVIFPDYLEKVISYFQEPEVGGVSGNVVVSEEKHLIKWRLRKALMNFFLLSNFKGRMTPSGFGYPIFEREIDKVTVVDLLPGYSMNYRRQLAIDEPSDEWFSGYGFREDVDLSHRISLRAKLIMVPDARFYHNHSQVNRLDLVNLKKMQFKNLHYLFKKHRPQNLFYRILFAYSLFGILFMDCVELVLNWTKQKQEAFKADLAGIWALKGTMGRCF